MYVVDVVPLSSGAPGNSLSYRSAASLSAGTLVTVPLRKRKIVGVVVGCEKAENLKATLKAATFTLSGTIGKPVGRIPATILQAIEATAAWHAASRGAVLSQLLGEWVELADFPGETGPGFSVRPIELPFPERKARYRARIAENEKDKRATLFVVSTLAEVEYWKRAFADFSPVVLSGALKGEKRKRALKEANGSRALVIATPTFAFAQMRYLDSLLIERVGAGGFRAPRHPYVDARVALLELARSRKLRYMYGDYPLPLELRTGARKLSGRFAPVAVIDSRSDRESGQTWSAVPAQLFERIRHELDEGGRVAVFAARKGYSPVVICRDCGEALKDERGKAYAFSIEGGKRVFRTSDGKSTLSTERNCPVCGSWNLMPLGVGVERVFEELTKAFPKAPCILFDADTVRGVIGARRRLAPLSELGSVVVGTEAMAPWLLAASPAPLSLAAVASADSLLAAPFWRARERFLRLGLLLPAIAPRAVVATRLPLDAAVRTLRDPSDPVFFEEEESLRRALSYPPFGTLISLTWQGSQVALDRLGKRVRAVVSDYSFIEIPDRLLRPNQWKRTLVLTLPENVWPYKELSAGLASLAPAVRVLVDPESFW